MGVRGIFTMVRKNLSSYSTRREYDADAHRGDNDSEKDTDKRDLIVVDGNAFVYWFVTFILGRESSCQTDYSLLSDRLDEWLCQCYKLRICFIFIFDGPTQPSKWPTKLKRMRNQSQDIYNSQVYKLNGGDKGAAPSVASVPPLLGMQAVIRVLKQHQTTLEEGVMLVRHAEGEADEEIVRVAVEQTAVAILSNDSDMLFFHTRQTSREVKSDIMPVSVPLLPFSSLHFSAEGRCLAMEALIQRQFLAKAMGVRSEHLWLLAALLGNDNSQSTTLLEIHRYLRDGVTSPLSSRSYSSFVESQSARGLDDLGDDWLDTDSINKNPKQKKKKNQKVSKNKKSPSKRSSTTAERSDQPLHSESPCSSTEKPIICGNGSDGFTKEELLRTLNSASTTDGDDFLMSSQETIKAALKLFKGVYNNIETSIKEFTGDHYDLMASIEEPQDVYDSTNAMCICVVSALLSVPVIGVLQAVSQRDRSSTTELDRKDHYNFHDRMPWCVSTSRTAMSCRRLYDCLRSAYDSYTVTVRDASQPLLSYSKDLESELGDIVDTSTYRMPWDLQMVLRYQLYLPRVSYEYSGMPQSVAPPKVAVETDITERFVDKAYRGMFQMTLSDSCVYTRLRGIRSLVYKCIQRHVTFHRYCPVVEILRRGHILEVTTVSPALCDATDDVYLGERFIPFFQRIAHEPLSTLLVQDESCYAANPMSGCNACKGLFDMRCLQLRIMTRLLEVVLDCDSHVENSPSDNCYSFQLSIVLLVGKHLCCELASLPCPCFKKCNFLLEGASALFHRIHVSESTTLVLTDIQLTNLWSTVEASVLHCDYLMFCAWNNLSRLPGTSCLLQEHENSPDIPKRLSVQAKDMHFPFACLCPSLFAGVHREVVRHGMSRNIDTFLASCYHGRDKSETEIMEVFHLFINVAMSR